MLDVKVKEFIYIAIDSGTTHLYDPGLRVHLRCALEVGASMAEIIEVLEITSSVGMHTLTVGLPIVLEELAAAGKPVPERGEAVLDDRQKALKARFEAELGQWNDAWQTLLAMDADYFEATLDFQAAPGRAGNLDPKVRELIAVAANASCTQLHEPAVRHHVRRAIAFGASGEELLEVLELSAVLGVHTVALGLPSLLDEEAKHLERQAEAKAG
ncbi:MAG: carboxymuconolactone decarboxylase family protein [Alphaproteobacteria bacterium]